MLEHITMIMTLIDMQRAHSQQMQYAEEQAWLKSYKTISNVRANPAFLSLEIIDMEEEASKISEFKIELIRKVVGKHLSTASSCSEVASKLLSIVFFYSGYEDLFLCKGYIDFARNEDYYWVETEEGEVVDIVLDGFGRYDYGSINPRFFMNHYEKRNQWKVDKYFIKNIFKDENKDNFIKYLEEYIKEYYSRY